MQEVLKSIYDTLNRITISGAENMNRLLWAMQTIEKLSSEVSANQEVKTDG